jgi:hypothetical protein
MTVVRFILLATLLGSLAGCGPTMVVLHNPATGAMAQCQADPWLNWNPYAATEACAKGYEAAGYKRTGTY